MNENAPPPRVMYGSRAGESVWKAVGVPLRVPFVVYFLTVRLELEDLV